MASCLQLTAACGVQHSARGILSMANSGPNTNASQFFITYAKHAHLNGKYTVFGRVIGGLEVLDAMEKVRLGFVLLAWDVLTRCYGRRRATPTTRR